MVTWNVKKQVDWKAKLQALGARFPGAILLLQEVDRWPCTSELEVAEHMPFGYCVLHPVGCKAAIAVPESLRHAWDGMQLTVRDNSIGIKMGGVGIVSSYLPDSSYDTCEFRKHVESAEAVMDKLTRWGCQNFVWGGDANVDVFAHYNDGAGALVGDGVMPRGNLKRALDAKTMARRGCFVDFVVKYGLILANTHGQGEQELFTHINDGSKTKTQIDFIGVSGNPEYLNCIVDNGVTGNFGHPMRSDHFPICMEVCWSAEPLRLRQPREKCHRLVGWLPSNFEQFGEQLMDQWRCLEIETQDVGKQLASLQEKLISVARAVPHSTSFSRSSAGRKREETIYEAKLSVSRARSKDEWKKARKALRKLRRKKRWLEKKMETESRPRLRLHTFEETTDAGEWPKLLEMRCREKYDGGEETVADNLRLASEHWKAAMVEEAVEEEITIVEVLGARSMMSKNKAGGSDNLVCEILLALPIAVCYEVAGLFNEKFRTGGGSQVGSWHELLLRFIKKSARPKLFTDLRGISLISCMSKWYMACVLCLAAVVPRPLRWRAVCSFGFMKERSVADIVGALTLLFAKANEWKERAPLYLFDGDVMQAFDYLTPALASRVMLEAGWSPKVRANII